ncbi:MAG: hydrogenase expression/formation protein HypE [Chloroflexota bacterium]|nr:MAG: hydrogenase expression/formation protein HypE [Chloroflexota bacterium]
MLSERRILMAHGSGGRLSRELTEEVFLPAFDNAVLRRLDDSAAVWIGQTRLAFTTDSFVVQPLFFPGGDIGKLAVCGTVNDLAMSGAEPLYLSAAFVIEEGLPLADLRRVVQSMRDASAEAGVTIVTGDTKVVERGKADGLYVTTAGVGLLPEPSYLSGAAGRPGDVVLVSGTLGDHGIAVISQREGLAFQTELHSDCAPLNGLVDVMLRASSQVHVLRDPTRGGLATALNEIADQSSVSIQIDERSLPVRDEVRAACEMLGFDLLYVANEGKLIALVAADDAERVLAAMRSHPYGRNAALIGRVKPDQPGRVTMRALLGGTRIVGMPAGELLPRIC